MLKVNDVLVVKNVSEIELTGAYTEGLIEGDEYHICNVGNKYITVEIDGILEDFTIEPSVSGLSWKTFFTVKEL